MNRVEVFIGLMLAVGLVLYFLSLHGHPGVT